MNPETLEQKKRILAKLMLVEDRDLLRLVETLLDQPCRGGDSQPEQVGILVGDVLRVLKGAQNN